MSSAHLHLIINHIPVLGVLFGAAILAYGLWRLQDAVIRVALGLFVASGLGAVGAYFSGEGAEEIVEELPGISHDIIETHEEVALIAFLLTALLGTVALALLIWRRRSDIPRVAAVSLLVAAIGVFGVLAYTANTGGKIRHTELRDGTTQTTTLARPSTLVVCTEP
jgi:crotonobetainyl-CoA:carnitine CoA-transferase CaiB-like acyl-CoA transferase